VGCATQRKITAGEKLFGDWQCACGQVNFGIDFRFFDLGADIIQGRRKECLNCGTPGLSGGPVTRFDEVTTVRSK